MAQVMSFPEYTGLRCLMMPFIQGDPSSVPPEFSAYAALAIEPGEIGYLTVDESETVGGRPQRAKRAKHARAIHTEAGVVEGRLAWGGSTRVTLDPDTRVLVASNVGGSCAVWDEAYRNTTSDGDIGHASDAFPYESARILAAGEVATFGVLTPHESLPVPHGTRRQFVRVVGNGVHGREDYFTMNPLPLPRREGEA